MNIIKVLVLFFLMVINIYGMQNTLIDNLQCTFSKLEKNTKYKLEVKNLTQALINYITAHSWNDNADYKVMSYELDKNDKTGFILLQKLPTKDFNFLDNFE